MGQQKEKRPGKRGGLLNTGNPGNKGGGRPKDEIRAHLQQSLEGCAGYIAELLAAYEGIRKEYRDGKISHAQFIEIGIKIPELCRVTDVLGKYSIGTRSEVEVIKDKEIIFELLDIIRDAGEDFYARAMTLFPDEDE